MARGCSGVRNQRKIAIALPKPVGPCREVVPAPVPLYELRKQSIAGFPASYGHGDGKIGELGIADGEYSCRRGPLRWPVESGPLMPRLLRSEQSWPPHQQSRRRLAGRPGWRLYHLGASSVAVERPGGRGPGPGPPPISSLVSEGFGLHPSGHQLADLLAVHVHVGGVDVTWMTWEPPKPPTLATAALVPAESPKPGMVASANPAPAASASFRPAPIPPTRPATTPSPISQKTRDGECCWSSALVDATVAAALAWARTRLLPPGS